MEYLLILTFLFLGAFFLKKAFHIRLYDSIWEGSYITLGFLLVGVVWDSWAVYRKTWTFSGHGLIGWTIAYLPIEEYLFMLILPYFVLTVYKVLRKFKP